MSYQADVLIAPHGTVAAVENALRTRRQKWKREVGKTPKQLALIDAIRTAPWIRKRARLRMLRERWYTLTSAPK